MSTQRKNASPHQFSRIRQTRVASISPAGTLIEPTSSSSQSSSSRSRNRSRTPHRGRGGRFGAEGEDTTESRDQSAGRTRWRSGSRTLRGSVDAFRGDDGNDLARSVSRGRTVYPIKELTFPGPPDKNLDVEKGKQAGEKQGQHGLDTKEPAIVRLLPHPIPHFLGHRKAKSEIHPNYQHVKPYPSLFPVLHRIPLMLESLIWTWVGSFVGIAAISLIFSRPTVFTSSVDVPPHSWISPIIIGSFGASSVLLYAAPSSPLGQPRCFVGGQFLSALSGYCVTRLFRLSSNYNLQLTDTSTSLVWLAGALSTATALVVMTMTGTLHPPGGATALLCATNSQVERLGWRVLPIVLLSSFIMLFWSLIWMNLGRRRYPESFTKASPPESSSGNIFGAIHRLLFRAEEESNEKKQSQNKEKSDLERLPAEKTSVPSTQPRAASTGGNPIWHEDGDWRNISEAEDEEVEERQERPSRWEGTQPRSLLAKLP
ncbi:hypothetical protein CBS101457_001334 [Exobasidium rhododendri]|nr:hypothetical protein CBS101457_001334 [Exobasidium rhododendri]